MDKVIYPKIDLCMTTGRRLELFCKTMKSFMENCLDIKLIDNWYISDDRSNQQDIKYIKDKYNFTLIYQSHEPGQLAAIKNLVLMTDKEWVLWMEDDWQWIIKDNFIEKAFDVIFSDRCIKQCTFRYWDCMYVIDSKHDIDYHMHVYSPLDYHKEWDIIKMNDCTYGGLTFNPSIIHVPTLKECLEGVYQDHPENRGWDKNIAIKFWDMGCKRANLTDNYIDHIGNKLTYYKRNK